MLLATLDSGLCACDWCDDPPQSTLAALSNRFHVPFRHDPEALADAAGQLRAYFAGRQQTFRLPCAAHGSPFQQRIWAAIAAISYGQRDTYAAMAAAAGSPRAVRAAGQACGRNPLSIFVPCHRVVGSGGRLTGYGGGLRRKQWLLEHERRYAIVAEQAG